MSLASLIWPAASENKATLQVSMQKHMRPKQASKNWKQVIPVKSDIAFNVNDTTWNAPVPPCWKQWKCNFPVLLLISWYPPNSVFQKFCYLFEMVKVYHAIPCNTNIKYYRIIGQFARALLIIFVGKICHKPHRWYSTIDDMGKGIKKELWGTTMVCKKTFVAAVTLFPCCHCALVTTKSNAEPL